MWAAPPTVRYATLRHVASDARFVLSSGGHIAGIVNPPGTNGWYLTNEDHPDAPEQWHAAALRNQGSWWEDWAGWAAERSGDRVAPPGVGSDTHPVLGDGPGEYVRS